MSEVGGIEAEADLRAHWKGVRDQGARPTCLACAASDAHAHAHTLAHPLSVEYVFFKAAQQMPEKVAPLGLTLEVTDIALRTDGQPNESDWPYQVAHPDPWRPPTVGQLWYGSCAQLTAAQAVLDALQAGSPVLMALRLVPGFRRVQSSPYIIDPSGVPAGGHAVLTVGAGRRTVGGPLDLLLIRNSWGFRWGFGGHAWLPIEYLADKLIGARQLAAIVPSHPC
jgi:hypothetical protein